MKLRYIGPFGSRSGYAQAAHDLLLAIHRTYPTLEMDIQPLEDINPSFDNRYKELLQFTDQSDDVNWPTHVLVHTIPKYCSEFVTKDMAPNKNIKKIAYTTWESDKIESSILEDLRLNFDVVLVPSYHNELVFASTGARVLPHCIDFDWWRKGPQGSAGPGKYHFLWIGAWVDRKNPLGVVKAYLSEFKAGEPVKLTMISHGYGEKMRRDVEHLKKAMNLNDYPYIACIDAYQTPEELRAWHYTTDCFVSAHRGEGFMLGGLQALACGKALIATNYGGNLDYMPRSWTIDHMMTPVVVSEIADAKPGWEGLGLRGDQMWAEPGLDHLKRQMRLFANKRPTAQWGVSDLEKTYSYEVVAKKFMELIS